MASAAALSSIPTLAAPGGSIADVTPDPATPSARIRISGAGFGAQQGSGDALLVDGRPAPITQWDAGTIIAYVPEATALGTVPLELFLDGALADGFALAIEPRARDGRGSGASRSTPTTSSTAWGSRPTRAPT